MKVLIDTNVLISAILKDKEPETVILFIVSRLDIEWIVSPQILEEYKEVLSRKKFGLPDHIKNAWFTALDSLTSVIDSDIPTEFQRDQKDARFLASAIASKDLLIKLKKEKLVLDWRRKQQTRADVLFTIETVLDEMLPGSYPPDLYQEKCNTIYQHIYDSYYGAGKSVYVTA